MDRRRVERINDDDGDFDGKDLSRLDLSGIDFSQKSFRRARLVGTRIRGDVSQCDFQGADLSGADLSGAEFTQCEFQGASLRGARLDGAEFCQCEFEGAALDGVSTQGTSFSQCEGIRGLSPRQRWSSWDDIDDDDEKQRIAREEMRKLAAAIQGRAKELRDEEEIHVTGHFASRPFRVKLDLTWGSVEVELRVDNRVGVVFVHHDPEKKPEGPRPRDEWDDHDAREERHFLAPGVYLEEQPAELQAMQWILQQSPQVTQFLVGTILASQLQQVFVDATSITCAFRRDLLQMDTTAAVTALVPALGQLAAWLESGQAQVAPKPRVYIHGVPMAAVAQVLCRFCASKVVPDPAGRCPNCGAPGA